MPLLIKQLSGDEANILKAIAAAPKLFKITTRFDLRDGLAITSIEHDEIPTAGLLFPMNADMYRERLERLGLIRFDTLRPMEAIVEGGQQTGGRNFLVVKLTQFGATFMRACGTPPVVTG